MKTKKLLRIAAVLIINCQLSIFNCSAQFNKLYDFASTSFNGGPHASLISIGSNLYGTTTQGGANNLGTIFKINSDGTGYSIVLNFDGAINGSNPYGSLISDGIFLYGTTQAGGANTKGTIFKIKPDGTGYLKLLDFAGTTNGANPFCSLISDGTYLYGTTYGGGNYGFGTVFRIKADGTGGYLKLLDFAGSVNGKSCYSSLTLVGTFLYGMTSEGGLNNVGTVFKIKGDGTGGYVKLLDFNTTNGNLPNGSLISDGIYLYGMSTYGGSIGYGTIFKMMLDGSQYSNLLNFNGTTNGSHPFGSLLLDGSSLYGLTYEGGANSNGTLFKISTSGSGYSNLHDFSSPAFGIRPYGSLISVGNFLYGMTLEGGANGGGTLFKYYTLCNLTISTTQTNISCFGASNGTATVSTTGGTAPFTYLWRRSTDGGTTWSIMSGQTTATASGLSGGSSDRYSVTVTDANGCMAIAYVTITQPAALSFSTSQSPVSCFGGNNGQASITGISGPGYTCTWNTTTSQTGFTAYNLTAGTYIATISDGSGCTTTASVTVTQFPPISVTETHVNVSCVGGTNGSLVANVSGGGNFLPYTYQLLIGTTTVQTGTSNSSYTFTNLSSNNYTVMVSDANGCSGTLTNVSINQPNPNTWVQKADFGGTSRFAAVGFSIGTKGYIGTGTTDYANGKQDFWEWDQATNVWTQKANFGGGTRFYAVGFSLGTKGYIGTGSDGTALFQDLWAYDPSNNTWSAKANFPGTSRQCAVGFSIGSKGYIGTGYQSNTPHDLQDLYEYDPINNAWTAKANFPGAARMSATGFSIGTKGYIGTGLNSTSNTYLQDFYEWDPASNVWTAKANFPASNRYFAVGFSIGSLGYLGTGSPNSVATYNDFYEYDPGTNIWTPKANLGGSSRFLAVGFSIGSKGYIGTGSPNGYTSTVNDFWEYAPACTSISVSISSTNACNGSNGSATANISGGTSPFTYSWNTSPIQTTASISNLSAGVYSVTVTDANSLTATANVTINQSSFISLSNSGNVTICSGQSATITGAAQGGVSPYNYNWSPTTGCNTCNTTTVTPAATTTYTLTATDNNSCTGQALVMVTVNTLPTVTVPSNISVCASGNVATTNFTSNISGTTYTWTNNNTSIGLSANGSGSIPSFIATNSTASAITATITVTPISPAPASCPGPSASYTITVNPGVVNTLTSAAGTNYQTKCINTAITPITYAITGGGTGAVASGLPAGVNGSFAGGIFTISGTPTGSGTFNYIVTATGTCGQSTVGGTITVNPNAAIVLTSATGTSSQINCINNPITSITYSVTGGGTGAVVTGLPTGVAGSFSGTTFTISGTPVTSGTFNYTVSTTGACTQASATGSITVNPNATISLSSAAGTDAQTKCVNTAITTITYALNGGGTSAGVNGLPAGVTGSVAGGVFTISGTPTTIGTFNYTVTSTGTCTQSSVNGSIIVNPNAIIVLTSALGTDAQNVCLTNPVNTVTYSVTGGGTGAGVTGLPTGVSGSFSGGAFTISGTPTSTGTYNYTVTTTGTCTQTSATGTINANPKPTLTVPSNITICANEIVSAANFSSDLSGTTYTWTNSNSIIGLTASGTGNVPSFTATNSTASPISATITVTPTSAAPGSCAGTSANYTITVNPNPVIINTPFSNETSCGAGDGTISINANGAGLSYSVNGGTSFVANSTFTALSAGSYPIMVKNTLGCTLAGGTISISSPSAPTTPVASSSTNSLCAGNPFTLSVSNPVGAQVYYWSGPNGYSTTGASATITNSTTAMSGTYAVTAAIGNCVSAAGTVSVVVNPLPTITSSSNISLCTGGTVAATNFSSTPSGSTYNWTNSNTSIGLAASGSGNINSFTGTNNTTSPITTTISVTPTSASPASCIGTPAVFTITVNPDAAITLSSAAGTNSQTLCLNTPIAPITYSITGGGANAAVTGLPAGVTGSFTGGTFTISGTPTTTGTFNYTVTTTGTCAQTSAVGSLTVNPNASVALSSSAGTNAQTLCINSGISVIAYSLGGSATSANIIGLPSGVTGSFAGNVFFISGTPTTAGTFNYTVTTTGTCTQASATGTIIVNPNASIALTSTTGTDAQTKCINMAITPITYSLTGGGTGANVTGLPSGVTGSFTGGVFTISGMPTSTGTFNYTVTTTGICAQTSATGSINVNPNSTIVLSSSSGTDAQTLCINTPISSISYSIAGGATGAGVTGLPTGLTGVYLGGVFTISGTPATSGTFNYTVTTTGTCSQTTATGNIIVNPSAFIALTSAAGTDAQTKCINTAITSITYSITGGGTGAGVTGLPTGVTGSFTGSMFTITGTPTVSGTFNYTVSTTGTCTQTSATGSIIVNPNAAITITSATGTDAQTKCINTAITSITYSVTGGGTGATITGLPTSITGSYAGGVFTISGTPTVSGTFNYTVTTTGTCTQTYATGSIIVNPNASVILSSTVGTDAQTLCINSPITSISYSVTGGGTSASVTGLPAGITGSFAGGVFTISGTPTASGTFNYSVTSTGTCTQATATGSIIVNPNATIALTSANGTDAQTKCINTAITSIIYSVTGGGTGAGVIGLPTGVTGSFAGGVFTISGTPTVSGTFNYTITTTGSCTQTSATGSIIVNSIPLAPTASSNSPVNVGNTLSLTASTISGATYSWLGPNSFSSPSQNPTVPSITIANAGTYSVTATVNGCTSPAGTTSVTVITISLSTTHDDVSCIGGNDGGAAVVSVAGGTAPYTYLWSTTPAQTSQAIFNLSPGTYTVTVTDANQSSATASVSVNQPQAISIFTNPTNVFCYGGNNGTAHAIAGGGTPPYSYSWNTFPIQTNATASNLSSGNYTVTVTDAHGCTGTNAIAITQPQALSVSMTIVNSNCGTTDGNLTANVTGGTSPYSYQWSNGTTTAHISNLASQTYSITVTDAKGCTINSNATIGIIAANFNLAFTASPQAGTAPFTGTFTNGTPNMSNYNFAWYWGDGNNVNDNNSTVFYTYNFAGTYDVALIATSIANGCKDTLAKHPYINVTGTGCNHTATLTPASTISKCLGDTVVLTASTNATPPYSYQWNIGSVSISGANSSTLAVTQGGYYSVTIIKNNCPVTSSAVQVNFTTNPQQPTITSNGTIVPCLGGSVTLTASAINGVTYSWNTTPVQNTSSIIVGSSGNYMVTATNTAGCTTASAPFIVNASLAQVPICMVSVDSFSTHTIIFWEKPLVTTIDSFKIYREVTTNTYAHLATVSYDSLSEYHDYGADPNATSYKYKLTLKDSCGNESPLSDFHNTIHLQYLGLGNLQWTLYDIENDGNPVDFYRVYRDDNNTGIFLPISSTIPGGNSTFTDVNYSNYPNSTYRVDVAWSINCSPTRQLISTTRSNIKHQNIIVTGVATADESNMAISIYPNPANESVTIELSPSGRIGNQQAETKIKIFNSLGQLIEEEILLPPSSSKTIKQISVSDYAKGIYWLSIENNGFKRFKKLVVN